CAAAFFLGPLLWAAGQACGAPPLLFHTPGYESPVRGDPDDLLMIAGTGFHSGDRVVYQAASTGESHPADVPSNNTARVGTAPVVQAGEALAGITVRLPAEMLKGDVYRLWVVTAGNEWSDPVTINDPRPMWITPAYVYATAMIPSLGRTLRIVGRNLTS